jgi:hypothetical protein
MTPPRSDAPAEAQEASFRFLADPHTHKLSGAIERASAFDQQVTKASPGRDARIADHKMFMFGSVELRHEEQRARLRWG